MPKDPFPQPKPPEPIVLGPYDLWCQVDRTSGLFAITDHHGNRQWTGGTADIPPDLALGRYNGLDSETLGLEFHDLPRWQYFQSLVELHSDNGAQFILDVVARTDKEAE